MGNVTLGFPNLIDTGNLSGGAWTAEQPLRQIQFRQLGRVARSIDVAEASTQFTIDFLQSKWFQAIALVNHNISFGGRWTVQASNAADFSVLLLDQSADAWAAMGATEWVLDELVWEADNFWLGTYSLDDVEGLTPLAFMLLSVPVQARYVRVLIGDTGNGDGYIDVGRCFIGEIWSPQINMSYGASFGYEDPTGVEVSLGGAEYFDERDPYRVMRFQLNALSEADEGFAESLEIMRRAGVSGEILVIPDPDDSDNAQRRNFLGRLRQLSPLEHAFFQYVSTAFEIKELK